MLLKKPLEFTPLGTRVLSTDVFTSSPYRHARNVLHVSSVPAALPCREHEFESVYESLRSALVEDAGTCIYISGPPGTGKTATVREVIAHLNAAIQEQDEDIGELDDFAFVEINGMKLTDPHQSYALLWETLTGDRVSPTHALDLLEREFSRPSPDRRPCVVLMDELDQLVTKNQAVMYNFFNWPALRYSRLVVLAVANTMDLPERMLSNKISSRLGLTRITFSGYKHQELIEIISSRLENVPGSIVEPDAIQFASRKVAAVSGDARRALDICRRAVEIAEQSSESATGKTGKRLSTIPEQDSENEDSVPATPSKRPSRQAVTRRTTPAASAARERRRNNIDKPMSRVTIPMIKQAIHDATSTPLQQFLKSLPLSCKVFLAGFLDRIRRTGITESTLGDIADESKRKADGAVAVSSGIASVNLKTFLMEKRGGDDDPNNTGNADPRRVRLNGLRFAAIELMDAGILALEGDSGHGARFAMGKGERSGRIRLRITPEDVKSALRDDEEAKMLGVGFEQ